MKYALLMDEEIENLKDYYRRIHKRDGTIVLAGEDTEETESEEEQETPDPEDQFTKEDRDRAAEIIQENQYVTVQREQAARETRSAFETRTDDDPGPEVDSPVPVLPERDPDHQLHHFHRSVG